MTKLKKMAARHIQQVLVVSGRYWFAPASHQAYGLLRWGFAITSLLQLIVLWPDRYIFLLDAINSNTGSMIDNTVIQGPLATFSLFHHIASPWACNSIFLIMAAAMLALAFGIYARLAIILVTYWHLSLYFDLAPAMSGYDHVLRLTSLILLVSPLGIVRPMADNKSQYPPSYGLRLIQWQLFFIYLSTVWLKTPDQYWRNGEFLSYFMLSIYSHWPSAIWAQIAPITAAMTYATLAIELAVPFLLWQRRWLWLGVILGLALHLGIAASSTLWLFSLSMLMLYPAYFKDTDFEMLKSKIGRLKSWITND